MKQSYIIVFSHRQTKDFMFAHVGEWFPDLLDGPQGNQSQTKRMYIKFM
jgi:hypothetical protein